MGMNVSDLSLQAQRQILNKLSQSEREKAARKSKFGNERDSRGSLKFQSKKEARRYDELMLLLKAGHISDLKLQQNFTLQEGFTTTDGRRIRPVVYKSDFTYRQDGRFVVEDAKGYRTQVYINKKKQMQDKFGIAVREV